jgi:uncharacterized pyridoxamine 5'-phosphate oxidase family protein
VIMEDVLKKLHEITESNPKLKERLENYTSVLSEFLELQNRFYTSYVESVVKKFELLKIAFEISFEGSINPKELIIQENKTLKQILKKGKKLDSLLVTNYSSLFELNNNLPEVYKKLIQGLEIEFLEKAVEEKNTDLINELSTVKALYLYGEFLQVSKESLASEPIDSTEQEPRKYSIEQYSLLIFLIAIQ